MLLLGCGLERWPVSQHIVVGKRVLGRTKRLAAAAALEKSPTRALDAL